MAEKRRVGRPRAAAPPAKKVKTGTPAEAATPAKESTPVVEIEEEETVTPLPNKILESKALPTLSQPQPLNVPDDEYQSIASSAVLAASLERSRQRWMSGEFLERYWTKITKKEAKNAPNNPQKSWMKEIGHCTIIVEPLILEATAFFVREPGSYQQPVPRPSQQYAATSPSPYGTPYRPQPVYTIPQQQSGNQQSRALLPGNAASGSLPSNSNTLGDRTLASTNQPGPSTGNALPPQHAAQPPQAPASTKPSPDPVIQMLATRASSDPELKSLMKVVATGLANQEQLRVFQRHIDELTAIIQARKAEAIQPQPAPTVGQSTAQSNLSSPSVANNSNGPSRTSTPHVNQGQTSKPSQYPLPPSLSLQPGPYPSSQQQRHGNVPAFPVVLEFNGLSASVDRFLFPRHSIVEFLSPVSILASFLVFRKGDAAVELSRYDPETTYYEPVTVKIDVEDRGRDVLEHMRRSVHPPDEVRNWMEDKMRTCKRAEKRFLALRLPWKSQLTEDEMVEEVSVVPEGKKPKSAAKKDKDQQPLPPPPAETAMKVEDPANGTPELGRRRSVKKSVRISELGAA